MSRRAVYTGSFDPISLGHLNVIERSSRLVDELIVGVGHNIDKQSLFTAQERVDLIKLVTKDLANVEVKIVMTPPWTPDLMSEEARDQLGIF